METGIYWWYCWWWIIKLSFPPS